MTTPIADYEGPRHAVNALLQTACDRRILLLRGPSGTGKTKLLEYCRARRPSEVHLVTVDLRGGTTGLAEIFSRFVLPITGLLLPRLTDRVKALESGGTTHVVMERNWQLGFKNRINVVVNTGDEAGRAQRRTELTDALFEDLGQIAEPVLVLFDTFEQAPTEVKDWLSGPFLARVAQTRTVRVVIAGQKEMPESNTIDWGHCCESHDLQGVRDAQHWLPVVRAMRRRIPGSPEEIYMAGICDALQGNPLAIMSWIEGLKHEEAVA